MSTRPPEQPPPVPATASGDRPAPPARRPRRLSPLTPVVRAPIVVLAVVGASWRQILDQGSLGFTGLILLSVLVAGAVYGVASWFLTTYWVSVDELRIDTGVLVRQSRRIRIDRLQGVDIVQPLVARAFGLAELRLDTAGGDREGRLAFLPHSEALDLRRVLLERRDDLVGGGPEEDHGAASAGAVEPERVLARLDPGRLIGSLVLSTETLVGAVAGVVMLTTAAVGGSFAVFGLGFPALLAVTLALGKRLSGYYNFTLSESSAGLNVRRGLTSLSSQTISRPRIQGYVVTEPLLWRRMGWARLDVSVAGQVSDADDSAGSSTIVPVAPREEVIAILRSLLGDRDPRSVPLVRPPRRAAWRAPLTWWNLAIGLDDDLAVSRRGWWVRRTDLVPHERSQSMRVTQGPLQRLLGLADVHVDSPPGPVHVRGEQSEAAVARAFLVEAARRGRAARHRPIPGRQTPASRPDRGVPDRGGIDGEASDHRKSGDPQEGTTPPRPETTQ